MRQRRTRELLLRDSSRLSEDLLTVTRLIQDNVQKSAHTVDTLGESTCLEQRHLAEACLQWGFFF